MPMSHDRASGSLVRASTTLGRAGAAFADGGGAPVMLGGRGSSDPLADVLRNVRLTGALCFLVDASTPWGVEVPAAATLRAVLLPRAEQVVSYHIIVEGGGWVRVEGAPAVRFEAGDILMMPHGEPYAMLSGLDQGPEYDAPATIAFLREMAAGRLPLVVEEGGGGTPRTVYVCGYLGCDARPFNPLLAALPRLLHVRRTGTADTGLLGHLVACAMAEVRTGRLGGECIRLGLTELLFVEVVRRHLEALPARGDGWLAGLRDPAVGRVLAMLHGRLAQPWTLRALADGAALSRAALADRFMRLVGCPPIEYLTRWRMQVAARLLADPGAKVSAVATRVGYRSEAAFSRAFKKATGIPPAAWRRRTHPAGDTP